MEDLIIDYSSLANVANPLIPTHVVTFKVDKCPAITVNLLKVFLTSYIPTKRFTDIVVACSDGMVIREHLVNRIQFLSISRKCPVGKVKFSRQNGERMPLVIDSADFSSISAYINFNPLCEIRQGAFINVTAMVEENTYSDVEHVRHNFICNFDRSKIVVTDVNGDEDYQCADVEYNSGEIGFTYQDTISAKDVMKLAKELILAKLTEVEESVMNEHKDCFSLARGIGVIYIKSDYSSIIANALLVYLYMADLQSANPQYYQLKDKANYSDSQLEIHEIELAELKTLLKAGIEMLKKDVIRITKQ